MFITLIYLVSYGEGSEDLKILSIWFSFLFRAWQQATKRKKCLKPEGDSCTAATPDGTQAAGLGSYYQSPCHGVGCNFLRPECRLCANDRSLINRPYRKCPKCVPKVEGTSEKPSHDPASVCELPRGKFMYRLLHLTATRAAGLGVYYGISAAAELAVNFNGKMCRLCAKDPTKINRPYRECPSCVVWFSGY